jgi:hypothetical protein
MISPGVVAAIHLAGVRGEPCGAVRWINTVFNVKKCMCWCLSIIGLDAVSKKRKTPT